MPAYDLFGNIALVKFSKDKKLSEKKNFGKLLLKRHKQLKTVVEKKDNFKGRLRKLKVRHIAGDKNLEALYKENGCLLRFNVESCYFSSRLVTERLELAGKVKKGEDVLVMFGGVAPFAVVIAKNSKVRKIASIELSRECNKYANENVRRNGLIDKVEIIQGDVRKKTPKKKFDRVIMTRPNLKDSFLDIAFKSIKSGGVIHYYCFSHEDNILELKEEAFLEAKKAKKKVKLLKLKKAGDIAPGKYRYRMDLKVY